MRGFLYFVPNKSGGESAKAVITEAGGAGILYPGIAANHTGAGPGGPGGMMLSPKGPTAFDPNVQQWQRVPGGAYWIGIDTQNMPGPDDLIRQHPLPGHRVELADGHEWVIPMARRAIQTNGEISWAAALPTVRRFGDDGTWVAGDIVNRYKPLWNEALRIDAMLAASAAGGDDAFANLDFDAETNIAALAIAANYRVGPVEISLLGLISSAVIIPVVNALLDMPSLAELVSKKVTASGEVNISPGAKV